MYPVVARDIFTRFLPTDIAGYSYLCWYRFLDLNCVMLPIGSRSLFCDSGNRPA